MNLPERKKNRLADYKYSLTGAYFITVCTEKRKKLFWEPVGAIIDRPPNFQLSEIGEAVKNCIEKIPEIYKNVTVDKFAVMPDHIHLILSINADESGRSMNAPTVSRIVKQLKGASVKKVGFSFWQKGFYDHIIRNDADYEETWNYIEANPTRKK